MGDPGVLPVGRLDRLGWGVGRYIGVGHASVSPTPSGRTSPSALYVMQCHGDFTMLGDADDVTQRASPDAVV